jgi:septal ring factor EnvC (AmiA/AmiB activator)
MALILDVVMVTVSEWRADADALGNGPKLRNVETKLAFVETKLRNVETKHGFVETKLRNVETKHGFVETKLRNIETKLGFVGTKLRNVETKLGYGETKLRNVETKLGFVDPRRLPTRRRSAVTTRNSMQDNQIRTGVALTGPAGLDRMLRAQRGAPARRPLRL